jgi:hypothetical protein
MKRYTYFLKLSDASNKDKVLHELENYLFHASIEFTDKNQIWLKWYTENYSGHDLLQRLKIAFLLDTWIEEQ